MTSDNLSSGMSVDIEPIEAELKPEHPLGPSDHGQAETKAEVLRMTLLAATLGLLAGLYEGAFLRSTPRLTGLLTPDVSNMIWFLAPSIVSLAFAPLGLAVGLLVSRFQRPAASILGAGIIWGNVGAYLAASVELSQARSGWILRPHAMLNSIIWFLVLFIWATLSMWLLNHKQKARLSRLLKFPLKPWAATLILLIAGGATGVAITSYGNRNSPFRPTAGAPIDPALPNIVLITWDTARADHVSAYGYVRPTTPNLDRLAALGVLFENAISPSSWTLPTFAAIFTGLLPHQHGANVGVALEESPRTLAKLLGARGYETAGFNANSYYGMEGWGIAQGFLTYDDVGSSFWHNLGLTVLGRILVEPAYRNLVRYSPLDRFDARQVNRDVFRWYEHRSKRPYFLFVNYFDAHRPYSVPAPFDHHFGYANRSLLQRQSTLDFGHFTEPLSEADLQSLIAAYDNGLYYADSQFGELMKFLSTRPEWSNTYVIVTADHGDGFGEHGTYDHGWNLYRELVHVPLVICGPGIPQGVRIPHIARVREIFPTVLDLTAEPGAIFLRTTLRRFWKPGFTPETYDLAVVSELADYRPGPKRQGLISLMTNDWHYLHVSGGQPELYKWHEDPFEQNNLAGSAEGRVVAKELRDRLYRHIGRSLRPWRGLSYLIALDGPGYSVVGEAHRVLSWNTNLHLQNRPTGSSQDLLRPDTSPDLPRLPRLDEELVKSLPYD